MKKLFAVTLLAIIGISSLVMAVAYASAVPSVSSPNRGWGWEVGRWIKQGFTAPFQRSWVRLKGIIETWGSQVVNGSLWVQARSNSINSEVLREAASATTIWNTTAGFRQRGNVSYSFYAARLVKVNVTALEFDQNVDFFMNGTWNVFKVTINRTVVTSGDLNSHYSFSSQMNVDVDPILTNAYGELNVTDNWTKFVLAINGIDELEGVMIRARMRQTVFNKFKVCEDGADKVTRMDLQVLARNYGATPGWGSYDFDMDFNCNYRIDVSDLATAAANVGQ